MEGTNLQKNKSRSVKKKQYNSHSFIIRLYLDHRLILIYEIMNIMRDFVIVLLVQNIYIVEISKSHSELLIFISVLLFTYSTTE